MRTMSDDEPGPPYAPWAAAWAGMAALATANGITRGIRTARSAVGVGLMWTVMTVGFEAGFGHYVAKQSWSTLRADYDMRNGRLWPLVLVATAAAPAAARAARLRGR